MNNSSWDLLRELYQSFIFNALLFDFTFTEVVPKTAYTGRENPAL